MKCSILVPSAVTASRSIVGVEIADTLQTGIDLTNHTGITVSGSSYEYKLVEISSSVDEFLNNYNQFYYSGTSVYKSAGYSVNNRRLLDTVDSTNANYFDRTIPYAENMIHSLV